MSLMYLKNNCWKNQEMVFFFKLCIYVKLELNKYYTCYTIIELVWNISFGYDSIAFLAQCGWLAGLGKLLVGVIKKKSWTLFQTFSPFLASPPFAQLAASSILVGEMLWRRNVIDRPFQVICVVNTAFERHHHPSNSPNVFPISQTFQCFNVQTVSFPPTPFFGAVSLAGISTISYKQHSTRVRMTNSNDINDAVAVPSFQFS